MDADSGVVIATSAITATSTLLAVGATGLIGFLSERARSRRESNREDARVHLTEVSRQREIAEGIADHFLKTLPALRRADPNYYAYFDELFYEGWYTKDEPEFRREIGRLTEDNAREQLLLVVESIGDSELARWQGQPGIVFVERLAVLGTEIAQALARDQQPAKPVLFQIVNLMEGAKSFEAYKQENAELGREHRQRQRERRREERAQEAEDATEEE